jgi:type II secretory pathway pseudopilin PulG
LYKWQQVCAIFNLWLFCPSILSKYRKSILNFIAKKTVLNMKNKEFYKLLKKNNLNSNSGFTLIELLVGLMMSIFVIGALGFGLMTVLQANQSESSKVKARNENSRALDFISDEVRRARTIETDATSAGTGFTASGKTIVLALDLPEISSSANVATRGRIMYYLKSTDLGNWKGPQVLYRWGPPLAADGSYGTGSWQEEALIDGINNTTVTSPCTASGGTVTPATPTGFYACITGTNTAQLFLTGQTKTASGVGNDSQTNDSKVVARARTRAANTTNTFTAVNWSVRGLGGKYECNRNTSPAPTWDMRTDFGNNSANPDQTTKWIQNSDSGKQPQPIEVDSDKDLIISSSAIDQTGCNSIGNEGTDGSEALSSYTETLSHIVDFDNPYTFNGDRNDATVHNQDQVDIAKEGIRFLKKGAIPVYGGYEADPNNPTSDPNDPNYQPSLGKFLYDQKMAIIDPTYTHTILDDPLTLSIDESDPLTSPLTRYIIPTDQQLTDDTNLTAAEKEAFITLGDDQRIVAIEMGQKFHDKNNDLSTITGDKNPGFDLQDNIFVVTSDAFSKKYPSTDFVPYNSTTTP